FNIIPGQHENEMEELSGDIKEESKSQNSKDRLIFQLRAELERLQAENISEWDKREILETEKQGLEKENRRLKAQVKEMEELLDGKNRFSANSQSPDFKTSQIERQEEKKEEKEKGDTQTSLNPLACCSAIFFNSPPPETLLMCSQSVVMLQEQKGAKSTGTQHFPSPLPTD
ncbi:PREDICTED: coiled-coil domain-containing protein 102B-like, partial [Odobenus rosmarus divergens]|uniref:Coiled-coil domain-containing protein 102B-like n=1 Tax=Odobenus rosmarus divergens TaxID=9708 RepID=A0A2U3W389_ODORO